MRIKEMSMRAFACVVAAAFAIGIGSHAALSDEEGISGIDIRLPIVVLTASEGVGIGLMVVENLGAEDDVLMGVGASDGVQVRMHLTGDEDDDGVVQMNEIEELHIAGNTNAIMSPDGPHLMLFDLDAGAEIGDVVNMTLNFKEAGAIEIEAIVLDELPPEEFAMAAFFNVHPDEVLSEREHAEMGMYDGMYGHEPEIVYVPVPVYIPVPVMPGGFGHGMGYGMGHGFGSMGGGYGYDMDHGHGHDMDHGYGMGLGFGPMDFGHGPMGYGGMPEPYHH